MKIYLSMHSARFRATLFSTLVVVRFIPKEKELLSGTLFLLEQATRVELAGSSLGSCRHTARRRLHYGYFFCRLAFLLYPFSL